MLQFRCFSASNYIKGNFKRYALVEFPISYKTDGDGCIENEVYVYFHPSFEESFLLANCDGSYAVMNEGDNNKESKRTPICCNIPRRIREKRDRVQMTIQLIVPVITDKEAAFKSGKKEFAGTLYLDKKMNVLKRIGPGEPTNVLDHQGDEIRPVVMGMYDWSAA